LRWRWISTSGSTWRPRFARAHVLLRRAAHA
jgi:hypothetical protein